MEYTDALLRPTKVTAPNGQQTITEYGDLIGNSFEKEKVQIDSENWEEETTYFDGLGRQIKNQTKDDSGDVFSETVYDIMGRVWKTTNPYREGETKFWNEKQYDDLGRTTRTITPDGAQMQMAYSVATAGNQIGTVVTITDQAGKLRRSVTDASGQLIRIDEPDLNGSLGPIDIPVQATVYKYSVLENLVEVDQGEQVRIFAYDALERLITATNPESGTFHNTFDASGNLLTRIDARGISTTFTYDALDRVILRNYSDSTPDVSYTYDDPQVPLSKGRLTKVATSASESMTTGYDADGRVTNSQQKTAGQTYSFIYTYDLDGNLLTQTYPSGKIVEFKYDSTGDLSRVGKPSGFTYASSFSYTSHGELSKLRLGNGRWETTQFNSRQQITEIGLGFSESDSGLWKTRYEYGEWQGSTLDVQKNNNSLAQQTITVPTIGAATGFTAVQKYFYDPLDRLNSANETISGAQTWKQTFLYDRYSNRTIDPTNTTMLSTESAVPKVANPEVLAANNRLKLDQDNDGINDYAYDPSGNLTANARGQSFTFDAENLMTTATGSGLSMTYSYDGDNRRVRSYDAINDRATVFVYDASGQLAAEYTVNVPRSASPTISYLTNDAVGSVRVTTNSFGDVQARRDFLPFGEELYAGLAGRNTAQKYSSSSDDIRKKFATYQRDSETGLDFAQSRYYSAMHGRFTSPDEFKGGPDELFDFEEDAADNPTFYADLANPQSLNKYQYGYNNPYKFNDPDGHCPVCVLFSDVVVPRAPLVRPQIGPLVEALPKIGPVVETVRPYTSTTTIDLIPTYRPIPIFSPTRAAGGRAQPQAKPKPLAQGRAGKNFTPKGKRQVKARNAEKHGGKNKCENCGKRTVRPRKTVKGAKRPPRETQVDHVEPKSKGGSGTPDNGQVLCRTCNQKKGAKIPEEIPQ